MVVVSQALVDYARRLAFGYEATLLSILVESETVPQAVFSAAEEALAPMCADEAFWSVALECGGVVIRQWGYTPGIVEALEALATGLGARGVTGVLVPGPPPEQVPESTLLSQPMELLECHLRARGERRVVLRPGNRRAPTGGLEQVADVSWFPDVDAWLTGFDAMFAWFSDAPSEATFWTIQGTLRGLSEVKAYIADAHFVEWANARGVAKVWWQTATTFKLLTFQGGRVGLGDMSLVQGGSVLDNGWEDVYARLLDVLRSAASWSAYGFIKRGRHPGRAGAPFMHDWLPQSHYGPNLGYTDYEDVMAPDIFGAQLLGAGYAGRVRPGSDWITSELKPGTMLVAHRDPAAWFGGPLPLLDEKDRRSLAPGVSLPEVVERARREFADILITPEIVRSRTLDPLST